MLKKTHDLTSTMAFNQLPDSNWELTKICKLKQSAGPVCHINTS